MKKLLMLILSLVMIFSIMSVVPAAKENENVLIYETANAPVIDGELDDLYVEFLVADSAKNQDHFILNAPDNIRDDSKLYACWDKTYLYLFAKIPCNGKHVAYMEGEHYIFNAHYLMTAICPDAPDQEKYKGTDDNEGGWEWGALYGANIMYEWTMIKDSKTGKDVIADHFNEMSNLRGFQFAVTSKDGFDCYEQRIPMAKVVTGHAKGIKAKVGYVFGYGFAAGLTDVGDGYQETDDVVNYSEYFDHKTVNKLVKFELASNLKHEEDESKPEEESKTEESKPEESKTEESKPQEESKAEESKAEESKTEESKPEESKAEEESKTEEKNEGLPLWSWIVIAVAAVAIIVAVIILIKKKKN